jgi:flagellum-specific peptidoglycan hydrolase FlgJ
MKQAQFPIPAGWKLFFQELYRRIHRQFTSPWTKLIVLCSLCLILTRKEFSFSLTINPAGIFQVNEHTVFQDHTDPKAPGAMTAGAVAPAGSQAVLAAYETPKKEWTARQLKQLAYVEQYREVALEEMEKHGIPASITLAQGLLESGTGRSTLARKNNNHFGIKCFSKKCHKGHCSNHSDDHHKDFFRIYGTPEESYRAHSKVLMKDRYRKLFGLSITDYQSWAKGLSKAGYATDPRYARKLIAMIEDLELHRYDKLFTQHHAKSDYLPAK